MSLLSHASRRAMDAGQSRWDNMSPPDYDEFDDEDDEDGYTEEPVDNDWEDFP